MDLLFQRYASPFSLLNHYIGLGRFEYFVNKFIETINSEKEEKCTWEIYLHKVFDKSFKEFKESIDVTQETANQSIEKQEATVLHSLNILQGFNPTQREGGEAFN